jgi:hypothetical protein
MDAIDILETNLFSPIRVMGCIALSTAFSAATVLVAASLVPELEERYQLPGTRVSRALNILTNHRWQVDGVASAKEQLEQLVELVRAVKSQRRVAAGEFPLNLIGEEQDALTSYRSRYCTERL